MRKLIQFAMFISIFSLGYMGLNYYIFYRIGTLLNVSHNLLYFLIILSTISFPVTTIFERKMSNIITRILYVISSTWLGIAFFLLYLLLAYEVLEFVFKIPSEVAGIGIIGIGLVVSAYSIFNASRLNIKEIEIPIRNLPKEMKIVQLSDIHMGSIRNSGFIKRIVEITNTLHPDIVLITGDTVDGSTQLHPHMFDSIDKLNAPAFLVLGNHEFYEGLESVFKVLSTTNIKILRNEMVEFEEVQIIGVDYSDNKNYLKKILPELGIDKLKPSILMHHLPQGVKFANKENIDLQLSGHTHNGQVFPINFLGKLIFPYMEGLYEYNNTKLYVSQGTGTWGPPMRLGSKNEITVINLKKDQY